MIAQSGGPTAVINSSVYGCIKEFISLNGSATAYAGLYGIQGILENKFVNADALPTESLKRLPAAALGSSRYQLKDFHQDDNEYKRLIEIFQSHGIRYFFYIGGNDSMDTADKIYDYSRASGLDLCVCGIPKTVDNDLALTDHCPGFGSAAKFIATAGLEIWFDINTFQKASVMVLEVMGRDAGWLAAAASILESIFPEINMLVYLPEKPFDIQSFLEDVNHALVRKNKLLIFISEGIKDRNGEYIGSRKNGYDKDDFGHRQLGGAGKLLQRELKRKLLKEVKLTEFGVLQRCSMHCVSRPDIREAEMAGRQSVRYAMSGKNGFMTALKRNGWRESGYECSTEPVALKDVSNRVHHVPENWILENGKCNNHRIFEYALPLMFDNKEFDGWKSLNWMTASNLLHSLK